MGAHAPPRTSIHSFFSRRFPASGPLPSSLSIRLILCSLTCTMSSHLAMLPSMMLLFALDDDPRNGLAAYGPLATHPAKRRWPKRHFLVGPLLPPPAQSSIHPSTSSRQQSVIAFTPCLPPSRSQSSPSTHPRSPCLLSRQHICSHPVVAKQQLRASSHKLLLLLLLLLLLRLLLLVDLEPCALALLSPSCLLPSLASFAFEDLVSVGWR